MQVADHNRVNVRDQDNYGSSISGVVTHFLEKNQSFFLRRGEHHQESKS